MIERLKAKLTSNNVSYSNQELQFLLENIGNPDPQIRDELVCNLLGKAFLNNEFTLDQAKFLVNKVLGKNLLFYHLAQENTATLTRSFSALLFQLIITINSQVDSRYFNFLSLKKKKKIYQDLIRYLEVEHDYTDFSSQYGWIHAIAHASDALEACVGQDDFTEKDVQNLMFAAAKCLKKVDRRFIAEEEHRLANVIFVAFKDAKISEEQFLNWIQGFDFNLSNLLDFYRFCNLKSLLEDLYIKLNKVNLLTPNVKKTVEEKFIECY